MATTRQRRRPVEPSLKFLAIVRCMAGLTVCGITGVDRDREPELYDTKEDWYTEQARDIHEQAMEVERGEREPCECGTEEEIRAVLVYPDGRIIDACDLVTDYRKIFDRDN